MLLFVIAWAKFGCARLQPGASDRPVIVYRSCTLPSSGAPNWLEVAMKRASRTGPLAVMNDGTVFLAPSRVASATCGLGTGTCGLVSPGLLPPIAGCAWHIAQLLPLKAGPRPEPLSILPETESTA